MGDSGVRRIQSLGLVADDAGVSAHDSATEEHGKNGAGESSARALASSTISGVLPFRASSPSFGSTPMHVLPPTVTAIEMARRRTAVAGSVVSGEIALPVPLHKPAPEPPAAAPPPQAPARWQTFDDIGLAPRATTKKAQRLLISTYRLLGFGILTVIVVVLLGYIGTTAFYFLNHSWVTPVAISPNDEKVVALQGQLASQLNVRAELVGELDQTERTIAAEQAFQLQFARAIKKDLESRRQALGRVQRLASAAAATRNEIRSAGDEFSASAASKLDQNYNARLIDVDQALAGKFQLAQISSTKLSLAERQAEFDQRATELATQTRSLDAILSDKTVTAALSYDVLKIARDYETSKLELAKQLDNRVRLEESLARQDQIIAGVKQSAYLRALSDHASVALVPYDNLENVAKDSPLYACRIEMVGCHEVGRVLDILPGEVNVKHPTRDSVMRGRMVVMELNDARAAEREVLFLGHAPLGL